jgi:hypothetical protein
VVLELSYKSCDILKCVAKELCVYAQTPTLNIELANIKLNNICIKILEGK